MKKFTAVLFSLLVTIAALAGNIEKVYTFSQPVILQNGAHQSLTLNQTLLAGLFGEPALPYQQVALMLPPGEKAVSITVRGEELTTIPGILELFPQQYNQPISKGSDGKFIKNEAVYRSAANYPLTPTGHLITSYLNGYAFALSTFTPVIYNPAMKSASYYRRVTITIATAPDVAAAKALKNLTPSENALKRVRLFAQNPEMMQQYPSRSKLKTSYPILIITQAQYQTGFQDLLNYYSTRGLTAQIATTESIESTMTGIDLPEKIRNYIIAEYQNSAIEQVVLGGDADRLPYRGLYCYVNSGGTPYTDNNIPADIYFSGLDGNWNANGNEKWGEAPTLTVQEEADLLPELSVGRMCFSTLQEQANMVHKSVAYQGSPVPEEMKKPFLVSEFLYDQPPTYGSDYLELIVDDHSDNGYSTYGIPSATNNITRLYDTPSYNWTKSEVLDGVNAGKAFIHHCGHSNWDYMMRLSNSDIKLSNFSQIDGITHNYQLMYTHGCICGAFDESDCIAEKCTSIANFLVAGVFNSRYGWFNQGQTEGPSAHIHREFISALYHPDPDSAITELGSAHTMSKIKTAPWIGLPGEFEPGAQRWCFYDCNVLGDPALKVWIDNTTVGIPYRSGKFTCSLSPNPTSGQASLSFTLSQPSDVTLTLINSLGQTLLTRTYNNSAAGLHSDLIDLSSESQGVYFCRIETKDHSSIIKLIVVR